MSTTTVMLLMLVVGVPGFIVIALSWIALVRLDRNFEKEK